MPARFVIRSGNRLSPPTVSAPASLAVQVSIASGDGRPHHVVVKTPTRHALAVPAHGRRAVLVSGLKAGRYAIEVDGVPGGALMIGGEPGP